MLSRATILSGQQHRALIALGVRNVTTTPASTATSQVDKPASSAVDSLRPIRGEPGKVRMGFLPEEWFQFFYKKTGVTGPYVFGVGLTTYLVSKEIYVMEHEYYSGLSLLIMCIIAVKKLGPSVAAAADKMIDDYEASWNESRVNEKKALEAAVKDEQKSQWQAEGQTMLMQAKKENVQFQLEAIYRDRMMTVYNDVKKRLDYQVEKRNVERKVAQKHLVNWVIAKVKASITPDQEKQNIDKCIADLTHLIKL